MFEDDSLLPPVLTSTNISRLRHLNSEILVVGKESYVKLEEIERTLPLSIDAISKDNRQKIYDSINSGNGKFLIEGIITKDDNGREVFSASEMLPADLCELLHTHGIDTDHKIISNILKLTWEQTEELKQDLLYYFGESYKPYHKELFLTKDELKNKYAILKPTGVFEETSAYIESLLSSDKRLFTPSDVSRRNDKKLQYLLNVIYKRTPLIYDSKRLEYTKSKITKALETHILPEETKRKIRELIFDIKTNPARNSKNALLFVGPPATGKTTLAKSIADALEYDSFTISLGGCMDSSCVKGGEVNYSNSEESPILKHFQQARTNACVIVFEELEKTTESPYGSPQNSLLNLIDNAQSVMDECLEIPIDVSNTVFIFTANSLEGLSEPLLSRMQIIEFTEPSFSDKVKIVEKKMLHSINKEFPEMRLKMTDECIAKLCCSVYDLRTISSSIRSAFMHGRYAYEDKHLFIGKKEFDEFFPTKTAIMPYKGKGIVYSLGVDKQRNEGFAIPLQGRVYEGPRGSSHLYGNAENTCKESFEIACKVFEKYADTHGKSIDLYFLSDEIKAGYSGGLAMIAALASSYYDIDISRCAFTGAIGLDGTVLPVGSIQTKICAAQRGGLRKVYLPYGNYIKLEEAFIKAADIEIVPIESAHEFINMICRKDYSKRQK